MGKQFFPLEIFCELIRNCKKNVTTVFFCGMFLCFHLIMWYIRGNRGQEIRLHVSVRIGKRTEHVNRNPILHKFLALFERNSELGWQKKK